MLETASAKQTHPPHPSNIPSGASSTTYDQQPPTDNPQPTANNHFFTQFAQRIIKQLSQLTPKGRLYAVDTLLRPIGIGGALALPFTEFTQHFAGGDFEAANQRQSAVAAIVELALAELAGAHGPVRMPSFEGLHPGAFVQAPGQAAVVDRVPGLRQSRESLALAVGLRIEPALHRDADRALPVAGAHEYGDRDNDYTRAQRLMLG